MIGEGAPPIDDEVERAGEPDPAQDVGTASPVEREGRVVTWGDSGIIYEHHPGNLRLLDNVLAYLAQGRAPEGQARILYTDSCDPRTDPELCRLAPDESDLAGFFEIIERQGEIEFAPPRQVELSDFTLVVYAACSQDSVTAEDLRSLEEGGRILIIADNFCLGSARAANTFVAPMGLRFTDLNPAGFFGEEYEIAPGKRVGLLLGVELLHVFRVTPQTLEHSFSAVVQTDVGVLMARRTQSF